MKRGIFITGTDTGVGKTFIGTGIASALLAAGVDTGVMKPAETGCAFRRGTLVPQDALALMRAAKAADALDLVNPYRFQAPLAPSVAAAQEGGRITLRRIVGAYRTLARRHAFMIVEGAGGILVPLTAKSDFLDLAAQIDLPVLIVARPGLGTINHTLLTAMALRERRVKIAGIVLNRAEALRPDMAERTNPAVIAQRSGVPIIGIVQHGQAELTDIAKRLLA